jgi:hypothetical protein
MRARDGYLFVIGAQTSCFTAAFQAELQMASVEAQGRLRRPLRMTSEKDGFNCPRRLLQGHALRG